MMTEIRSGSLLDRRFSFVLETNTIDGLPGGASATFVSGMGVGPNSKRRVRSSSMLFHLTGVARSEGKHSVGGQTLSSHTPSKRRQWRLFRAPLRQGLHSF